MFFKEHFVVCVCLQLSPKGWIEAEAILLLQVKALNNAVAIGSVTERLFLWLLVLQLALCKHVTLVVLR